MIARGAQGNPWLFREIEQALKGEEVAYPTDIEKVELSKRHLELCIDYFGEGKAIREMRKHIAWYIKGLKNCTDIKNVVNTAVTSEEVFAILDDYKKVLI